ncbi:UNVERIFIED_CONTAM: hypothetical protein HDU68_006015 [Siphonaria sp. JEL0065]|nr:hypothetical protein HDU68_006015 [Siphonaria sp. JEL0065]
MVKQLGVLVHVDDDDSVLIDLIPHVKRLIRVKRSVRVSIEADKRRMSVSSLRSRNTSSPPPECSSSTSACPSPNMSVGSAVLPTSVVVGKRGDKSSKGIVSVEDDDDEDGDNDLGSGDSLDSAGAVASAKAAATAAASGKGAFVSGAAVAVAAIVQPIPIPIIAPTSWLLDKFKGLGGSGSAPIGGILGAETRPLVVVNGGAASSGSSNGRGAGGGSSTSPTESLVEVDIGSSSSPIPVRKPSPFQRTQSQASFNKQSSSVGSTLSRNLGGVVVDSVPDVLKQAVNVEFVEGIEMSSLLQP